MTTPDKLSEMIEDYHDFLPIYCRRLPEHEDLVDLCTLRAWCNRQQLAPERQQRLEEADAIEQSCPRLKAATERARKDLESRS